MGFWGAVLEFNTYIDMSRYQTWAPYKQSVLLKLNDRKFLFGDGSTVKNPSKEDPRIEKVSNRLISHSIDLIGSSSVIEKKV